MSMITTFFDPYLSALVGAAFSLQQALEGLKIHGSNFLVFDANGKVVNSYWSANEAIVWPLLGLLAFVFILIVGIFVAVFVLGGMRAVLLGFISFVFPGLLSLVGLWPSVQWSPKVYNVGAGELGSPWGMFALLAIALATGWTAVILLSRWLRLDDRFRHGYDQFWYSMAIVTGLFFVADLSASQDRERLRDSSVTSRAASGYLLEQMRSIEADCKVNTANSPVVCQWSKNSQWEFAQYADYSEKLYWQLGPETSDRLYAGLARGVRPEEIQTLRQELHKYNLKKCPVKTVGVGIRQSSPISRICKVTPASFCIAFADVPLRGVNVADTYVNTVAIANECVIPALVALKVEQTKLSKEVAADARARHLRWMLFLFISLLAGGKVANASIRMFQAIEDARKIQTSTAQSQFSEPPIKFKGKTKSRRWILASPNFKFAPKSQRSAASTLKRKNGLLRPDSN